MSLDKDKPNEEVTYVPNSFSATSLSKEIVDKNADAEETEQPSSELESRINSFFSNKLRVISWVQLIATFLSLFLTLLSGTAYAEINFNSPTADSNRQKQQLLLRLAYFSPIYIALALISNAIVCGAAVSSMSLMVRLWRVSMVAIAMLLLAIHCVQLYCIASIFDIGFCYRAKCMASVIASCFLWSTSCTMWIVLPIWAFRIKVDRFHRAGYRSWRSHHTNSSAESSRSSTSVARMSIASMLNRAHSMKLKPLASSDLEYTPNFGTML